MISLQLVFLRSCGSGVRSDRESSEVGMRGVPHLAPRSPPRSFCCECILQAAIDFAEVPILAMRGRLCTKIERLFMPINKVFELGRRAVKKKNSLLCGEKMGDMKAKWHTLP